MPTAEKVRDRTVDTFEAALERAEDLMSSGTHGLAVAVNRAVDEVRDRSPEIELPTFELSAVELPNVDDLVEGARSHKVRTAVAAFALLTLLFVVVKKLTAKPEESAPPTGS
jgi:hypothetical protein